MLLLRQAKQMEEAGRVDNVGLPLQSCPRLVVFIEDVGAQERRLQAPFVSEQRFAHVEEARLEVDGFAVGRGGAVVGELADVLGEAAAEVDEGGVLVQPGQDSRVDWVLGEGTYEGAEKTDARVWADGIGTAMLDGLMVSGFQVVKTWMGERGE